MIYLVGIIGFLGGFLFGQIILSHMLRGYSRKEILDLMKQSDKRLKYGLINWSLAILGAVSFIMIYRQYFFE